MSGLDCRRYEGALMEFARAGRTDADTARHLEGCQTCRASLDRQRRLSSAAVRLANDAALFSAPASVENAIRVELESRRSVVRPFRRRVVGSLLVGALAASLAIVWFVKSRQPAPISTAQIRVNPDSAFDVYTVDRPQAITKTASLTVAPAKKKPRPVAKKPVSQPEEPFIAIPYTPQIEPYERAEVMRVNVPVAALIAAGLPMSTVDPTAKAQADVLVGQDGRARAVRLIAISTLN